jgi:hypothetical protein
VFEVHVRPDAQYGTADDSVISFATPPFGSNDPEGLAFGVGKLYIADRTEAEVYVVDPGRMERSTGYPRAATMS